MNFIRVTVSGLAVLFVVSCGSQSRVITTKKEQDKYETPPVAQVYNDTKVETATPPPQADTSVPVPPPAATGSTEAYIILYKEIAKDEMRKYKIPASITLAQGILESGSGRSELAVQANNHFGIKCTKEWNGETATRPGSTDCYRKYAHAVSSFEDHSQFLKRSHYDFLFSLRQDDYEAWAKGLRAAGYATDRKYPEKLITIIERYQLYKYDEEVLATSEQAYPPATAPATPSEKETTVYVVKEGDTLYSISRAYNMTVKELMDMNTLTSSAISVGQQLKVKE